MKTDNSMFIRRVYTENQSRNALRYMVCINTSTIYTVMRQVASSYLLSWGWGNFLFMGNNVVDQSLHLLSLFLRAYIYGELHLPMHHKRNRSGNMPVTLRISQFVAMQDINFRWHIYIYNFPLLVIKSVTLHWSSTPDLKTINNFKRCYRKLVEPAMSWVLWSYSNLGVLCFQELPIPTMKYIRTSSFKAGIRCTYTIARP